MRVLIVQSNRDLGLVWQRHLERMQAEIDLVGRGEDALELLRRKRFDVIVLDLVLEEGSAFAVSDYAQFNQSEANIVFVTDTSFFSDGSIFVHSANARAFIEKATPPDDLAAIVEHYGTPREARNLAGT
ncbi:response regulator [Yoonia sp. 208BN28-4]|uniref:response regulator n=1 Tax=Yoonia sp. 208BN28-4 TaxID=3126505 RepID=UPI0030A82728